MLENDGFWEDLKDISYEEGYILGMTISQVKQYKIGVREIKRAYRSSDLFSEDVMKTLRNLRKLLLNEPFTADMEIYLHRYPRLDNRRLARKICAESEYRYSSTIELME